MESLIIDIGLFVSGLSIGYTVAKAQSVRELTSTCSLKADNLPLHRRTGRSGVRQSGIKVYLQGKKRIDTDCSFYTNKKCSLLDKPCDKLF